MSSPLPSITLTTFRVSLVSAKSSLLSTLKSPWPRKWDRSDRIVHSLELCQELKREERKQTEKRTEPIHDFLLSRLLLDAQDKFQFTAPLHQARGGRDLGGKYLPFPNRDEGRVPAYSMPRELSALSRSGRSIRNWSPLLATSSTSSKARNNRILADAYCSVSLRARPCARDQAATTSAGRMRVTG